MKGMRKQYWNRESTNASLRLLRSMPKELDFVLIGGWAVYMYIGAQKSQDIDIVIGYDHINYFRQFGINEYRGGKVRYSNVNGVIVDLFIEDYIDTDMPFPSAIIGDNYVKIENIKVVDKNLLLLLKLWGYFSADEIKHRKDIIDVVSLLFYGGIDLRNVKEYADRFRIGKRKSSDAMLEYLDIGSTLSEFIVEKESEYEKLKSRLKKEVKEVFE